MLVAQLLLSFSSLATPLATPPPALARLAMVALLPTSAAVASFALAANAAAVSALNVVDPVHNPLPGYIGKNLGAYSPYAAAGVYPAVPKGCSISQVSPTHPHVCPTGC